MKRTFYLNYVGCKVTQATQEMETALSFTLTMWDVKK